MPFRIANLFNEYLKHEDINDYLDYLQLTYPKLVTVATAGESYEGRPIKTIRISSHQNIIRPFGKSVQLNARSAREKPPSAVAAPLQRSQSTLNINRQYTRCATVNNAPAKPYAKAVVLIDAGLHAREWASVSTALYCINQLVEYFEVNSKLLLHYDFVILPILNVDGYEFSRTKVSSAHVICLIVVLMKK